MAIGQKVIDNPVLSIRTITKSYLLNVLMINYFFTFFKRIYIKTNNTINQNMCLFEEHSNGKTENMDFYR